MTILRRILHRLIDLALTLAPGHRDDPNSLEARIRRNDKFFETEADRVTAQLGAKLEALAASVSLIDERAASDVKRAIANAELGAIAIAQRLDALKNIDLGEKD